MHFTSIKLFTLRILGTSGLFLLLILLLAGTANLHAQIDERLFERDHRIDPGKKGELLLELDNLSFFKDNEYEGNYQKGYTLPGLWIQPKLVYYPLDMMKIELGLNLLRYWGTNYYPNTHYTGIPAWNENRATRGLGHLLPYFRFQVQLYEHVNVVLGNLYGGASHRLSEPLYHPEYNLTADPEAGVQLLFDYRHFTLDGWMDWQSFIYGGDDHQEQFVAGISSKVKFMKPESRLQLDLPLQLIFRHQGGEIDSVDASVKTWLNAGTGIELSYRFGRRYLEKMSFNVRGFYSSQQAGKVLPVGKGWGFDTNLSAEVKDFKLLAGYWKCDDFFTIEGNPFFGCLSTFDPGKVFRNPSMIYGKLEYTRKFGKCFALGAELSVYHHFSSESETYRLVDENFVDPTPGFEKAATSIGFGVCLKVNPSFLLKKFKQRDCTKVNP